jgi:hypothetical protein
LDVFEYFGYAQPTVAGNDPNSSTDAVADGYQDDRDDMDLGFDFPNDIKIEGFRLDPQPTLNEAFIDTDNQIPPEYANDPDLWQAIQASLKVRFMSEYVHIC